MIIYGNHKEIVEFSAALGRIEAVLRTLKASGFREHNSASELLIETGEFEASAADLFCPERDTSNGFICLIRELSVISGHIFVSSFRSDFSSIQKWAELFTQKLGRLKEERIFSPLTYNIPEGYAFYSLYPEMYLSSAENFMREFRPKEVTVIGIRSIGTSLSAVVSARLEDAGITVHSFTVRPRGFYFERKLILDNELEEELKAFSQGFYLIIDEGPGLSGSSFTSAAMKLRHLGVSDDRIIIFPSWQTDGSGFVSEDSRKIWIRHRKFTTDFKEVISIKKLFSQFMQGENITDLSAGKWRDHIFENSSDFPPVYPNFEQRKYLAGNLSDNGKDKNQSPLFLIKFAGLGRYGRALFERAMVLSEAGFSPEVYGFENGFIISRFHEGTPLNLNGINKSFLERVSSYLTFLGQKFPAPSGITAGETEEMIYVNLKKGLGDEWAEKFSRIKSRFRTFLNNGSGAALDGRMLPWEWLKTKEGFIKTDSLHHHKDHFFPGCQDIAWDIAGFCTEFSLKTDAKDYFLNMYSKLSRDTEISVRLPFYFLFYNAFRLGFAHFSAEMSSEGKEREKFLILKKKYSENLKRQLNTYY